MLKVSGNPSRWGRVDNLFGLKSIDACVDVYNQIVSSLGLPIFTRCTRLMPRQGKENESISLFSDGGIIREIHITSNIMTSPFCGISKEGQIYGSSLCLNPDKLRNAFLGLAGALNVM